MKLDIFSYYARISLSLICFVSFIVFAFLVTGCTYAREGSTVTTTTSTKIELPKCENLASGERADSCTVGSN